MPLAFLAAGVFLLSQVGGTFGQNANARGPLFAVRAPFSGSSLSFFNFTNPAGCEGHDRITSPMSDNRSTQKFGVALNSEVTPKASCNKPAYTNDLSYLDVAMPSFKANFWGSHVVRTYWWIHMLINAAAFENATGGYPNDSYAWWYVGIGFSVTDLTTGTYWTGSVLQNGTYFLGNSSGAHVVYHTDSNLSSPILVPFTVGHTYQLSFQVEVEAEAVAWPVGHSSASVVVKLERQGRATQFEGYTIR